MQQDIRRAVEIMGGIRATAVKLGCSIASVYLWLSGKRVPRPSVCVAIEQATQGAVTRRQLRADWRQIWPELAGAKAAGVRALPVARQGAPL